MGLGASVGRLVSAMLLASSVVSACAGHSARTEVDDGSADDEGGGSGGTGGTSSGGVPAGGGTGFGGAAMMGGSGGSIAGASGSTGVGGSPPCGGCPTWEYGLTIEGDGAPYELHFNGRIVLEGDMLPPEPPRCPAEPLLGVALGCGGGNAFSACTDPLNASPCLQVGGRDALYKDRQGAIWIGSVTSDVPNPTIPGVLSGTLTLALALDDPEGTILTLTVGYTFCTLAVNADIVCR